MKAEQKISATAGGFGGVLDRNDHFGTAAASPGDLDGDGVADLAVGALGDADGGFSTGAVWIVFLHADGTVKAEQKISALAGGFGGALEPFDSPAARSRPSATSTATGSSISPPAREETEQRRKARSGSSSSSPTGR